MLPWQTDHMDRIVRLANTDRLPHALLFRGPRHVGKRNFATTVAHFRLCRRTSHNAACGECEECRLLAAGTHPDFREIEPVESKLIKIEQVRSLIDWLSQTPQRGGARVVVIDPAEQMNVFSANALLKCLEEPGDNTLIMLVTDAPGRLLPTIRSRCQQLEFSIPDSSAAIAWLETQDVATGIALPLLLTIGGGAPLAVIEQFTDEFLTRRSKIAKAIDSLVEKDDPLKVAQVLAGGDVEQDLSVVYALFADALRLGLTQDQNIIKNRDLEQTVEKISNALGVTGLFAATEAVKRARREATSASNPNIQLLLEALAVEVASYCAL